LTPGKASGENILWLLTDLMYSVSDVQKRLRALLPKDYAKDYRKYRPSSQQNAQLRFYHVKYCTDDRVRKYRKIRRQGQSECPGDAVDGGAGLKADVFAGPASAFRNFPTTPAAAPVQYVSMVWLNLLTNQQTPYSDATLTAENASLPSVTICYPPGRSSARRSVSDCSSNIKGQTRVQNGSVIDNVELATDSEALAPNSAPDERHEDTVKSTDGESPEGGDFRLGTQAVSRFRDQEATISSEPLSIRSLRRRLPNIHSQSSLEHIESVLRYSLTNSWRSSVVSKISLASSMDSGDLAQHRNSPKFGATASKIVSKASTSLFQKIKSRFTEGEQRIWDDLVDESQLAQPVNTPRLPPEISLVKRPCCAVNLMSNILCEKCGFSGVFYRFTASK
jgi:hypothetical protein